MTVEISRKFFVQNTPDVTSLVPQRQERYFISVENSEEDRITMLNGTRYVRERLVKKSELEQTKERLEIKEDEYIQLKSKAFGPILRKAYLISQEPKTTLKIYQVAHKGFARAEVNFGSVQEAKAYMPESWMGPEITESLLGKDAKLVMLDERAFRREMERVQGL